MKNLLVGQSGGPTSVINSSLAGVIENGLKSPEIDKVLGAVNGIDGLLTENIISLDSFTEDNIKLLKQTPASYLGSCRKKLPEFSEEEAIYKKIFCIFEKYNIGYFFYIGGNDSMDTVKKLSGYARLKNIDIKIVGVPKTIDNDLVLTDHTPGYGSAAKFVINTIRQLALDTDVYNTESVVVLEIMGRNAGWLTAAAALANSEGFNPVDIICLPEVPFNPTAFLEKLKAVTDKKKTSIIAVSEGIKGLDGKYLCESSDIRSVSDGFSHAALGGVGKIVEKLISDSLKIKTRSIELSTLQRCFSILNSETDIEESFSLGFEAVEMAKSGLTGIMPGIKRISSEPYSTQIVPFDINLIANLEKSIPQSMISEDGMNVTDEFLTYAKPLIRGEAPLIFKDGLIQLETRPN